MKQHQDAVLVVEDEILIRLSIVDELMEHGFQVFEAGNADEAIASLEQHRDIRLVFTDIDMPGSMDGLRLAAFVLDRWPPIKVIVISGRFLPNAHELPENAEFFTKPYDYAAVIAEMNRLLLA